MEKAIQKENKRFLTNGEFNFIFTLTYLPFILFEIITLQEIITMNSLLQYLQQNKDIIQAFTSLLAISIGFLSIILTYLTLQMNRKHQRLSVKPIADITPHDFAENISVTLDNKGNGPLIIKTFRATKNHNSTSNLIDWMPALPNNLSWFTFQKNFEGTALRPGESLVLIKLKINKKNKQEIKFRDDVRRSLSELEVELEYSDIYGAQMCFPKYKLSWFARLTSGSS
jgi:hypothetical protein